VVQETKLNFYKG